MRSLPLLFILWTPFGHGATLLTFDKVNLVIVQDRKNLYGYYTGASNQSTIMQDRSVTYRCDFLFKRVGTSIPMSVRSFDHPIKTWESAPYSEGHIEINSGVWKVRFTSPPRGCASKTDQEMLVSGIQGEIGVGKGDAVRTQNGNFALLKKSPAIGIRWITADTPGYRISNRAFSPLTTTLIQGELVVELNREAGYSLVQYIDSLTKTRLNFWIESSRLTNPFPPD